MARLGRNPRSGPKLAGRRVQATAGPRGVNAWGRTRLETRLQYGLLSGHAANCNRNANDLGARRDTSRGVRVARALRLSSSREEPVRMRNNHDPNWRPIVDNGGAEIQKHWHISFLTVLALSGALWLGVILWFAMRWFGN